MQVDKALYTDMHSITNAIILGYLPSVIFKTTWILFKCINVTASILHNTRIMIKFPILYDFS